MLLLANPSTASKLSCSSLLIKEFKFSSQAWNAVASAKLQTSVNPGRKSKSFKHILKRRGHKTDAWCMSFNNSVQELKLLLTLVL